MINWSDHPPKPGDFAGVRLVRVPPQKTFEGLITSEKLQGCPTHYAERKTQPCTGDDCRHCLAGLTPRWLAYLSVWSTRTRAHLVLELTALASLPVDDYAARHGSIRGSLIVADRNGSRPNSPVTVSVRPDDSDHRLLPPEVDLRRFFDLLWHINGMPLKAERNPHAGEYPEFNRDADAPNDQIPPPDLDPTKGPPA